MTIAISLSPNAQLDDMGLAASLLFRPWCWKDNTNVEVLEKKFASLFGDKFLTTSVNSGRSALFVILQALGVGKEDEVVIQAFTCVAVSNSILWTGASPIYTDIDDSLNIDPSDLLKKLTKKTKAVIIQNTFGIPADYEKISKVIKAYNSKIVIIEDCAHALGAYYKGKKVGTLADVSFFSFGRDKVISSVFGGMILTKDKLLFEKIKKISTRLPETPVTWNVQQLLHPILFKLIILPFYNFGVGKVGLGKLILHFSRRFGVLSDAVYKKEKSCEQPTVFPAKMPGVLATLAIKQLSKLDRYNKHRMEIARYYSENLVSSVNYNKSAIYLRYPYISPYANELYNYFKKKGILIGDWYKQMVAPLTDTTCANYNTGECRHAEEVAISIVNLPTYPNFSLKDASFLVGEIKKWENTKVKK